MRKFNRQMITSAVLVLRRSFLTLACLATAGMLFTAAPAWAGNPHFVGTCTVNLTGSTATVSGKEAGLGDESQINLTITVIAVCINPGGNHPKASNKTANTSTPSVPVQNGKAEYSEQLSVVTSPSCSPPMTLALDSATVKDETNNISQTCTVVP